MLYLKLMRDVVINYGAYIDCAEITFLPVKNLLIPPAIDSAELFYILIPPAIDSAEVFY